MSKRRTLGARWVAETPDPQEKVMNVAERIDVVGEVHCLNCGRMLAEVARETVNGALQLVAAPNESPVQVIVAGRRMLRCSRCSGRALVELWEDSLQPTTIRGTYGSNRVA
jgi:hypothetical protein